MAITNYRPDIDGLRAVAVLAVVLHHLSASLVPGGYVGVDVFFVISGYLITRIISREMADGTFTFSRFYERRASRIFPALFAVLSVTIVACYFPAAAQRLLRNATRCAGNNILCVQHLLLARHGSWLLRRRRGRTQPVAAYPVAGGRRAVLCFPPRLVVGVLSLLSAPHCFNFYSVRRGAAGRDRPADAKQKRSGILSRAFGGWRLLGGIIIGVQCSASHPIKRPE